jgi:hypothetical protein
MQDVLKEYLRESELRAQWQAVESAETLEAMMAAAWGLARALVLVMMSQVLEARAAEPVNWPNCTVCGKRLRSKGWVARQWRGVVGTVKWRRRVGRCPRGCKSGHVAPLDRALGLEGHARTSVAVQEMACLLAVLLPFELASRVLARLAGMVVSASGVWQWAQARGRAAMARLDEELERLAQGECPAPETLAAEIVALPVMVGADGVKVPLRPHGGDPWGAVMWREVKVGLLARFCHRVHESGEHAFAIKQRRVVAVLGDSEALKLRLQLEALRQNIGQAPRVVWLSDGGAGLWRVFQEFLGGLGTGILDFYHAVQNVWKAVKVWKDGRSRRARAGWEWARRRLRYGTVDEVLVALYVERAMQPLRPRVRQALENLCTYLETHREHLDYARYRREGLPIGSGCMESACKWLIQQRFKGVGMRWSESGFNHLLHLRLAWANERFDALFTRPSPNR